MRKVYIIGCNWLFSMLLIVGIAMAQSGSGLHHTDVGIPSEEIFNLSNQILKERIEMFVLQHYKDNHEEIVVNCENLPVSIPVRKNDWDIQVESRYGGINNGTNLLDVTVFSKRSVYKQLTVTVRVQTFDYIVVAKKLIERHQKINENDVELAYYETTNFKRQYFTNVEDVIGFRTKQILQAGKPIFASTIELPPIIKRGDVIKIRVRLKNLDVTALGKALEDGRLGETIQVKNLSSGKRIAGEVIDEKTVLVRL